VTDEPIYEFTGPYRFLSNFFIEPDETHVEGDYQKAKTGVNAEILTVCRKVTCDACHREIRGLQILFNHCDVCGSDKVTNLRREPGSAKREGMKVTLRKDWDTIKLVVMHTLVWEKFTDHPSLAKLLLATRDRELIEGNKWGDSFWGVTKNGRGQGENQLGKILMQVRTALQEE
jgi:NADAR domain